MIDQSQCLPDELFPVEQAVRATFGWTIDDMRGKIGGFCIVQGDVGRV